MVRTRFAPSPTGFLHIGSVRTALYCWLYAQKTKGKCYLRIEDTDRERSTEEAVDAILEGLEWLALPFDDFDGKTVYQTQRFDRYREVAHQLLNEGKAYRCRCSKERLEKLRESQLAQKQKPRYDGHCREANHPENDEPFVLRFKNPKDGEVKVTDLIKGEVTVKNEELDDLIIVRSDGTPTYNFTVVIDDWDMKITHVVRGDDHLNNTPRQINILNALGAEIPIYAHMPMILGADGKRLSKRHGAVSVQQYREDGILPEALVNYLVRLGWSHGDQEEFSREEMIEYFELKDINKAAAAFNPEKLLWLNQQYIQKGDPKQLAELLQEQFKTLNVNTHEGPNVEAVVEAQIKRAQTLKEMAEKSVFFYQDPKEFEPKAQKLLTQEACDLMSTLKTAFENSEWQAESIHQCIKQLADEKGLKFPDLAKPLRVMVTGGLVSPSIDITLELIGKARVLKRIEWAIQYCTKA